MAERYRIADPQQEREWHERRVLEAFAAELDVPPDRVRDALAKLKARGLVSSGRIS